MKGLTNKVLVAFSLLSVVGSVFGEGSTFSAGIKGLLSERNSGLFVQLAGLPSNLRDCFLRDGILGATVAQAVNAKLSTGINAGLKGLSALADKLSTSRLLERVAMKDGLVNKMGEVLHTVGAGKKAAIASAGLVWLGLLGLKIQINFDPMEKWLIGNGWL